MNSIVYQIYCYIAIVIDKICRLLAKIPSKITGMILMYHHVTDGFVDTPESCKCTIERFKVNIHQLIKDGYTFVTVDQLLEILKNKSSLKFVLVTFDDATEDMFLNAYPILKMLNIPFVVYVTINFINKEGYINNNQLDILNCDSICTIGSHTITHPMLRNAKNAFQEIDHSKHILENRLGRKIEHFAYPYGKLNSVSLKTIRMVKKSGYKSAMGTIESRVTDIFRRQLWYLPRIVLK